MEEIADFSMKDYLTGSQRDTILMSYRQLVDYFSNLKRAESEQDTDTVNSIQGLIDSTKSEVRSYLNEAIIDYFKYMCHKNNVDFDESIFNDYTEGVYRRLFSDNIIKELGIMSFGEYATRYEIVAKVFRFMYNSFFESIGKSHPGVIKEQVSLEETIPGTTQTYEDILSDKPEVEDVLKKFIKEYVDRKFGSDVKGSPDEYLMRLFQDITPAVEAATKSGVEDYKSVMHSALDKAISKHLPIYKDMFQQETGSSIDSLSSDQIPGEWQWLKELSIPDQVLNIIESIKSELA